MTTRSVSTQAPPLVRLVIALGLGLGLAPLACLKVKVAKDPVPSRVFAEFDPGAPKPLLPAPNDLALDPATGRVVIPPTLPETEAEKQLAEYLTQLDGYPPESIPWMTFSGAIDPGSLLGSVVLFDLTAADPAAATPPDFTASWDGVDRRLSLVGKGSFTPGHTYGIVVRSSQSAGIKDAAGQPVLASPAFYLVRGDRSLVTCPRDLSSPTCQSATDVIPATSKDPENARIERRNAAVALERLRLSLLPLYALARDRGIAREDIVLAWTFHVSTTPTARFDIEGKMEVPIPFPNELLRTGRDGRIEVPVSPSDPAAVADVKRQLAKLDGFSTTAPLRAGVTLPDLPGDPPTPQPLDPTTVTARGLRVLPAVPGQQRPEYEVLWEPESVSLVAALDRPLRSKTLYLGALTSDLRTTSGRELRAPFVMALLRMTAPLWADGRSQIRGVPHELAAQAELARQALMPAFALAELGFNLPRQEIAVLFPFKTQTIAEVLPDLRALPTRLGVPTEVRGASFKPPDPLYGLTDVDSMVEGEMQTPILLGALGGFRADWSQVTLERVPYLITVPKCVPPGKTKAPVVILLHALGRFRRDLLGAADAFAQKCWAVAGIDLPFHGDRSACITYSDCDGGMCDTATMRCVGSGPRLADDGNPVASGRGFVNPADLFATRDNMRQGVIDVAQFLRVLRAPDGAAANPPGVRIDASTTAIVGVSMGGMIATMALAAMPEPTTGVLSTTAANIIDVLVRSPVFGPELLKQLAMYGLSPGTRAFREFDTVARWVMDVSEPANYAELLQMRSLPDVLTGLPVGRKAVIVQMGEKDEVMPNPFTELLAALIGVPLDQTTFPNANHEALLNIFDPDWARVGNQAAGFVASNGTVLPPP